MTHNLETVSSASLSALTVANPTSNGKTFRELTITKLGGFVRPRGVRVKARQYDSAGERIRQLTVDIEGEDLFALREFLSEIPEEAFVRPADPVEKPARWTEADVVQEVTQTYVYTWVRGPQVWNAVNRGGTSSCSDEAVSKLVDGDYSTTARILRQASGQDL